MENQLLRALDLFFKGALWSAMEYAVLLFPVPVLFSEEMIDYSTDDSFVSLL